MCLFSCCCTPPWYLVRRQYINTFISRRLLICQISAYGFYINICIVAQAVESGLQHAHTIPKSMGKAQCCVLPIIPPAQGFQLARWNTPLPLLPCPLFWGSSQFPQSQYWGTGGQREGRKPCCASGSPCVGLLLVWLSSESCPIGHPSMQFPFSLLGGMTPLNVLTANTRNTHFRYAFSHYEEHWEARIFRHNPVHAYRVVFKQDLLPGDYIPNYLGPSPTELHRTYIWADVIRLQYKSPSQAFLSLTTCA